MNKQEKEFINMLKGYSLSNTDIDFILNPDTKINTIHSLDNVQHFDELLDNLGRCIMLYGTESKNVGHWVALIKRGNDVEFFDAYGNSPFNLAEGLNIPKEVDDAVNEGGMKKLLNLIHEGGYNLKWNDVKFQKEDESIATCGRHTVLRLLLHKLSLEQYQALLKQMKGELKADYDSLITAITYPILNK